MRLNRRVQILLDEERYRRLDREAKRSGASVGEIVRRAIDAQFPAASRDTRGAAAELLAAEPMPVEDWTAMKTQMLDELYGGAGQA